MLLKHAYFSKDSKLKNKFVNDLKYKLFHIVFMIPLSAIRSYRNEQNRKVTRHIMEMYKCRCSSMCTAWWGLYTFRLL